MSSLPVVDLGGKQYRLPLSTNGAQGLLNVLLTQCVAQRTSALTDLLASDDSLRLWALGKAAEENRSDFTNTDALGDWLSPRLLELLAQGRSTNGEAASLEDGRRLAEALAVPLSGVAASLESGDSAEVKLDAGAEMLWSLVSRLRRLERLETEFTDRLLHEKLAALKEWTYGASHELNNPLFNISSRAQLLLREETDPERRKKLSTIHAHAMRASEMIRGLALYAHPPKPEFVECDAGTLAADVVNEVVDEANQGGVRLQLRAPTDGLEVTADGVQFAVCLRELCVNAIDAISRSGRVGEVTVSLESDGESVVVTVADNGPGLDDRASRHLFDPYFSGYESGRGLGMGLCKVWQIMQAHGGDVSVTSETGRGTTAVLRWPKQPTNTVVDHA